MQRIVLARAGLWRAFGTLFAFAGDPPGDPPSGRLPEPRDLPW